MQTINLLNRKNSSEIKHLWSKKKSQSKKIPWIEESLQNKNYVFQKYVSRFNFVCLKNQIDAESFQTKIFEEIKLNSKKHSWKLLGPLLNTRQLKVQQRYALGWANNDLRLFQQSDLETLEVWWYTCKQTWPAVHVARVIEHFLT